MTEVEATPTATEPTPATSPATETAAQPEAAASTRPPRGRRGQGRGSAGEGKSPAAKPQGPQRKPHPALERLFELYPAMFGANFLPLKLGVFQELMAAHPEAFNKDDLKLALGQHARSTRYLEAVATGTQRHDLQGQPVEPLAPEHIHHAILEVHKRRQARSKEDLSPHLRTRLVRAIEASGLDREAYIAIARSNDETANAALQEAFAEIAGRTAKREALQTAYNASGRSVAAFAEMYGLDQAEVQRMVEAKAKD